MMKWRELIVKYKHVFLLLYGLIYMPWFMYLEKHIVKRFNIIHMDIDDKIPFLEIFIVPYLLWFAYVAVTLAVFFFRDVKSYYRMCLFLFTGMTVFLIISTIYPNGHQLRPEVFPRDNIFTDMVRTLYQTDTPTNILPSIHVYNSIGTHIAIVKSECFKQLKWIKYGSFILMALIIMATVFLKQHSMFDVITAFAMAGGMYALTCRAEFGLFGRKSAKEMEEEYSKI